MTPSTETPRGVRAARAREQATVMFADLSGFTAMSERLDPEAVTDIVNHCLAVLEAVVLACGGTVDKYVGDCIIAAWDLPDPRDAALQACRAGLGICAAVRAINAGAALPVPLDVHVGLGSGPLIGGHVGGELSGASSIVGEAVVRAERIGQLSTRGQILVDAYTRAATADALQYRPFPAAVLAPKSDPVDIYELTGLANGGGAELEALVRAAIARATAPAPSDAGRIRSSRDSERRVATVMFAEVSGFEALSRSLSPQLSLQLLNRCFSALEPAVHAGGGVVDKYIGETIMALFGVPNAIENAPQQALNAAIEMRDLLQRHAEEQGIAGRLHLHVGINTGLVIAGELGGRDTRAFTVIGDTVNVAARLKAASGDGDILVGSDTFRITREQFALEPLPPLALKGKERRVPAWRLTSERTQRMRVAPAAGGITSALVGRERELAAVARAIEPLAHGRGGILGVIGEAGIGKSRLMAELLRLPAIRAAQLLQGRSLSIGQGLSFHPFVDLLRRWADIDDDDAPPAAGGKLAGAVRELMPDEFDDVLPFIARLMGLRVSGELAQRVGGLDGEAMEELIFKSVRTLMERLAAQRPLVLLFEDLHWADHSSIKLLESLLRLTRSHAVLIVAVGRPEFAETFERILARARDEYATLLTEVAVRRLTDEQCDTLIANLLRTDAMPYATRALIIRKAEGNPFYIEEVIRSFIDDGVIVSRAGQFELTERIDSVDVPETIQEVIMARVDRLDAPARHVLQIASVIGRSFYHRIIADVVGADEELDACLSRLKEKQLIVERESHDTGAVRRRMLHAEREYVFTHALAQDAIYDAILQRSRRELHRRVATAIEALFADRLVDFFGMLAYHFSRAEELVKAEDYLFRAGEEAARSAASSEALTFFREASQLYFRMHGTGGDARKKGLLEKNVALALLNTGALTESIEHFDNALEHLGRPAPRGNVARTLAFVRSFALALRQIYVWGGRRRRVADWDSERLIWEVLFNRGRAQITSDPTRLFFDMVTGFTRLNQIDATQIDQASAIYASCAAVFCYSGISFAVSRKALAAARQLMRPGNIRDEFTCASMEWVLHYLAGDWSTRHDIDPAKIDEALRHGQLWDVNTYVGLYADMKLRQGDFAAAQALVDQLGDIADAYGYGFADTNHDAMITLLRLEQRAGAEALAAAERYQSARHEEPLKVLGLGAKAKAQVLGGDLDGAAESLAAAERIVRRSREVPPWHLSAYAAARLRIALAALEAAGPHSPAALRRQARQGVRYAVGVARKAAIQRTEIYQLCGSIYWRLGRPRPAQTWWRRSLATGMRMGARPELARTYAALSRCLTDGTSLDGLEADACRERALEGFAALGLSAEHAELAGDGARVATAAAAS